MSVGWIDVLSDRTPQQERIHRCAADGNRKDTLERKKNEKRGGGGTSNMEFREAGVSRPGEGRGVCRLLTVRVGRGMRFYEILRAHVGGKRAAG